MLRNYSQKDLARKCETTQSHISQIELRQESLTVRLLYKIAKALNVCPSMLLNPKCVNENCTRCEYYPEQ